MNDNDTKFKEPFYYLEDSYYGPSNPEYVRLKKRAEAGEKYRKVMEIDPEHFVGQIFDFYGAQNNCFKLNGIVFEAIENPEDGYRSNYEMLLIPPNGNNMTGFFPTPLAKVEVRRLGENEEIKNFSDLPPSQHSGYYEYSDEGYFLKDITDGHIWLSFGTSLVDDYYPCFMFEYCAKEPTAEK